MGRKCDQSLKRFALADFVIYQELCALLATFMLFEGTLQHCLGLLQ